MTELSRLAQYPFLQEARTYIKDHGPSVDELISDVVYERARTIGIERLDNAYKNRDAGNRSLATESDCIMELLSYPIARMVAVCVEDTYFKRRYALGEAIHAYKTFINESTSFLLTIAKNEFKFDARSDDMNRITIHFKDYLRHAPTRYKEWKMINRDMGQGYVHIAHKDLARLLEEALRKRIDSDLDARTCDRTIYTAFTPDIKRFQTMVTMHKEKTQTAPLGKLQNDALPPCMKRLLAAVQAGENVPHTGRFALVAFLHSLKLSTKEILDIFRSAPDYEEDKTRYQVEHITGSSSSTSYAPLGCEKMRTYGVCPVDEIDEICKKIRHPRSYYNTAWTKRRTST